MQSALDECANSDEVRAVYITGNGKGFSAGQDLAEIVDPEGPGIHAILSYSAPLQLQPDAPDFPPFSP